MTSGGKILRRGPRVDDPEGMSTRADCCSARATYRVVLPATPDRDRPAELLLCGHHLRASRAALEARGAQVHDLDEVFAALAH